MNLKEKVLEELKAVIDPELGINVVDLGLIYEINIDEQNNVDITMTLTTPGCPLHDSITSGVKIALEAMDELNNVNVNLVWEPAWSPDKMSPDARKFLGA
ncbi:metal-sulfur cluster assembly factor [Calidifontibacillus oryziterrae]|uniref:metal-sulfur cluster assembly factor n=1 Tax=Calidifontibacillus oryziterrae TaxID=1191699 RepID=UPI0002E583B8|nr:metal-sulfur cluster assembly factor [Calidifontibacillus oryziterrae]